MEIYELNDNSIRENEVISYKHLLKIEKLLKDCDKMDIHNNSEDSFIYGFPSIVEFYNEGSYLNYEKVRIVEKEFISARMKKKYDKLKKLIDDKLIKDNYLMM